MTWVVPAIFVIGFVAILYLNTASLSDGLSEVPAWIGRTFGADRFGLNYVTAAHHIAPEGGGEKTPPGNTEAIARIVLSAILLLASLYVILSGKFAQDDKNWAFTTIGALTGFWLKAA